MDAYVEAQKRLPSREIPLETKDGTFYFFKADILSNQVTYSSDKEVLANAVTINGRRAFQIINMNKRGEKPDSLLESTTRTEERRPADLLEQDELTRFDRSKKGKGKKKKKAQAEGNNQPASATRTQQSPKAAAKPATPKQGGQPKQNDRTKPATTQQAKAQTPRQPRKTKKPQTDTPAGNKPQNKPDAPAQA